MKYNQPPIPMSNELKQVLQSSLGLTEAGLLNAIQNIAVDNENKPPKQTFLDIDKYCFGELNQQANLFLSSGFKKIDEATDAFINKTGLHELRDFINGDKIKPEVKNKLANNKE